MARADHITRYELIPHIREYEEEEALTLWNSKHYATLFSIEVLMDTLIDTFENLALKGFHGWGKNLRSKSLFPKSTAGITRSLFHVGKCGSLAHRLDLTSTLFYLLMSLPNGAGSAKEDHSNCSQTSCTCFDNMDQLSYRTRHTEDCVMCEGPKIIEAELVHFIRRDEVPLIRSAMDSKGDVTIAVTKMGMNVHYTAISHVWAGGLGNFKTNWLPYCQLQAIHQDVCHVMACNYDDSYPRTPYAFLRP
jgi:hypothetical protein